jgi:translation initiation factor IF-2
MPVRIYEIAKKLGIESKEVLAKAKELGITTAKVPSSSLDKITAEYLEEQFGGVKASVAEPPVPHVEPRIIVAPPEPIPPVPIFTPPPHVEVALSIPPPTIEVEPVAPPQEEEIAPFVEAPASVENEAPPVDVAPPPAPAHSSSESVTPATAPVQMEEIETAITPSVSIAPPTPPTPLPPPSAPVPAPPGLGEKVGFIKLPPKPLPRVGERVGSVKLPPRPAGRPDQTRPGARPDQQGARPPQSSGFQQQGRPQFQQGGRPQFQPQRGFRPVQGAPTASRPSAPVEPKFVPPTTGELICLKPPVIVRDLAEQLKRKPFQLIADLMDFGVFATVNQAIEETVAQRLCAKYGFRFEVEKRERGGGVVHAPLKKVELDVDDKLEDLQPRAPVVTIMGHVDHGKTTLLDVIRKANVAGGEAGGITQHIGAYTITIPHPERPKEIHQITFLDTPGHAAFSSMRARGANVTDIVILVVAANDGVMPQTLEALSHAQAAKVPIIVAVNKSDHPNANPMKVRQQLQDRGLVCEEWGGETIFQDVSALTKQGVDKLLELILLQAEIMELKANPNRRAKGNVIESGLEPGGPTATVLVRKGTLRVGDTVISGEFYGKVRALINEEGNRLKEAGPSVAVKLLGLDGVPEAGVEFSSVENEKNARSLAEQRRMESRSMDKERRPKITLENLFDTLATDSTKSLKAVVKADTQGSVEAIVEALKKIDASKVSLEIIHSAVGTITESDVLLASASKAIILGFHTRIDNGVSDVAKREGVQIKLYAIIYELIDHVKEAMAGLLDPLIREVVIGAAEVRKIFALSKGGNVAGCVVGSGRIVKGKMRVMRRKGLIFEGVSLSLRRFQDEVNEVRAGMECGIRLDGFDDFQAGDSIECYMLEKVPQKLA